MSLAWTTLQIPFAAGLNTKADPRALEAPALAVCRNAEFDEIGGLTKRKPYSSVGADILGGGTLANVRRIVEHGDERLCFTKDKLYSWSARDAKWVEKATYLAPKITEREVFVNPYEQLDTDRAELAGTILFTWADDATSVSNRLAYIAALDATTGAVILPPTSLGAGSDRPRLMVATTKVLLFWSQPNAGNGRVVVAALDPANLASSLASGIAAPTAVATSVGDTVSVYDVAPRGDGTTVFVGRQDSSSTPYWVALVTEALAVTLVSKARTAATLTVAAAAGVGVYVIRSSGANIRGDYLNPTTLADVTVDVAVGTAASASVNNVAVALHSFTGNGEGRAFWTSGQTVASTSYRTETNTFNLVMAGIGTQAILARRLALASRAFAHDGNSYAWLVFGGESYAAGSSIPTFRTSPQNTYFLFRGDGTVIAKAAQGVAGELPTVHLAGVQSLGSNRYAWGGKSQRRVPSNIGGRTDTYADHAPREIVVEFDSNEARRTGRLGRTLYITGGQILQYDGLGLWEVGFHLFPFTMAITGTTTPGNIDTGTHAYKRTRRWVNAHGEVEESTTATVISHTNTGAAQKKSFSTLDTLFATRKGNTIEDIVWRTLKNPTADAPFYRTNAIDPATFAGDNRYLQNDQSVSSLSYDDNLSDADLSLRETNYENGGILENLAPPAATIIAATQERLFLAGVAGQPYRIWYSKRRAIGEVAAFHDVLTVELPPDGGEIRALAFLNETLIAFCERAIYALPGDGFENDASGQNYGPARLLASDVGAASAEAVALVPQGLIFKSAKGWQLLDRGWGLNPQFGAPVADFDSDVIVSVHVMESRHQVRCMGSSSRCLVWDYLVGQWSEWTVADAVSAAMFGGTYHYATSTQVRAEQASYSAADYSLDVETAWIKLADLQGFGRVRKILPLGEFRSAHDLRIRVARNYVGDGAGSWTWFDSKFWPATPAVVGSALQVKHGPSEQVVEAIKVRLTDYATGSQVNAPAGEALRLTGLGLEVGLRRGLYRRLPVAQKQ